MTGWSSETLRALDVRYAEKGIPLHQHPLKAATDILGPAFALAGRRSDAVDGIVAAYREMIPDVDGSWPGAGIGIAAVNDQVRRVVVPAMFGQSSLEVWRILGFGDERSWWAWCREDAEHAARTSFAVADLIDFAYGLDDRTHLDGAADPLWSMAAANLADVSSILPNASGINAVIPPICMTVELSLKAALVSNGAEPDAFRRRRGHDLPQLARRIATETPHRDDHIVAEVVSRMPDYVDSRYRPSGLTRLKVVELALAAQFVAASSIRRFGDRDLAAEMEADGWPAPRRPLFRD